MYSRPTLDSVRLERLCRVIQYRFKNEALLHEALTHRSLGSHNYERLEFLGDSLLGMIVSRELYHRHPGVPEGDLSRLRASLVRGITLAEIARHMKLGDYLLMDPGALKSGTFNRDSVLADVVESLLAAIYLDSGLEACEAAVMRFLGERLDNLPAVEALKDAKTRLQELLQGNGLPLPEYALTGSTGKAHERRFTAQCRVPSLEVVAEATHSSRSKAEQAAASVVLEQAAIRALRSKP